MAQGPFPKDVLTLIYAELQYRRDVVNFRLACKFWNRVADSPQAQSMRRRKRRFSCAFADCDWIYRCGGIGEFQCDVCSNPEDLCFKNAQIRCVRCNRRMGPLCAIGSTCVCIECAMECEEGCGRKIFSFYDTPWDVSKKDYDPREFMWCSCCKKLICGSCILKEENLCFNSKIHTTLYVEDQFKKVFIAQQSN